MERTAVNRSYPQSERNSLVTFLNMTLQHKACSLALFVGGMVGSTRNRNWRCLIVYQLLQSGFDKHYWVLM